MVARNLAAVERRHTTEDMNVTNLAGNSEAPPRAVPPDSLEDAFARYQSELLGTLYYLVGNLEDARDALQETFIKCWRHQDKVAEVRNLKAWIFRVAGENTNHCTSSGQTESSGVFAIANSSGGPRTGAARAGRCVGVCA